MRTIRILLLFIAATCAVSAQQLDHPTKIPVVFYGMGVASFAPNPASFSFGSELGSTTDGYFVPTSTGQTFYSPKTTVLLTPGKEYSVSVTSSYCAAVVVYFLPINGCRIFLRGDEVRTTSGPASYTFTVRIQQTKDYQTPTKPADPAAQILPLTSDLTGEVAGLRGGESCTIPENRAMWFVGLGSMRNGEPAGALGFLSLTVDPILGKTSALVCDPADTSEVTVTRTGGYITQVLSRDVKIVVDAYNASSTSYNIKVYKNTSPAPSTPFVSYKVSYLTTAGGAALRVDRLEDSIQWTTRIEKTATAWVRYAWQKTGTGSSINSSLAIDTAGPCATTTIAGTYPATTETVTYGGCDDEAASVVLTKVKTYVSVNGRQELASVQSGATAGSPTTTYAYYTASTGTGWAGALQSVVDAAGNWTKYDYYNTANDTSAGMVKTVYHPWEDLPVAVSGASLSAGLVESYTYVTNYDGTTTALGSKTTKINNVQAGYTTWTYNWNLATVNGSVVSQETRSDYSSATTSLATVTKAYLPISTNTFLAGRQHSVTYPDKRRDSYAYVNGTWDSATNTFTGLSTGADRMVLVFHGQSDSTYGGTQYSTWSVGSVTWTLDPVYLISKVSTVNQTVVNQLGQVVFSGTNVYDGTTTLQLVSGTANIFNDHNLKTSATDTIRTVVDGTVASTFTYIAGVLDTSTDIDGVPTSWDYNNYLQTSTITTGQSGLATTGYPQKIQSFSYYPSGLVKIAQECSCSPTGTNYYYESTGRLRKKTEPKPSTTAGTVLATTYAYAANNRTVTETNPSNATAITSMFVDGRIKSTSGTARFAKTYDYSVDATGNVVRTTSNGTVAGAVADGWAEETFDWLGRTTLIRTPQFGWTSAAANVSRVNRTERNYNVAGQLDTVDVKDEKNSNAKIAPTHYYTWGKLGMLTREADDVDGSGGIVAASSDRIIDYGFAFVLETTGNLGWIQRETVSLFRIADDATTKTTISTRDTRLTKFNAGVKGTDGIAVSEVLTRNSSNRAHAERGWVEPTTFTRKMIKTDGGVSYKGSTTTINGYLANDTSISGVSTDYTYNTEGLLEKATDSTTGSETDYTYYDDTKYVSSVTRTTGATTTTTDTISYNWSTTNNSFTVTKSDGAAKVTNIEYNARGLPWRTWGSATTPSLTMYDSFGRQASLTTWTTATGWTGAAFPASPGAGNVTQWTIDSASGLVSTKTYADLTTVQYTYNPRGQIKTRTGSRSLLTTYNYFDASSALTGELKSVVYTTASGISTPTVSFTYTRFGAVATVSDTTGTRTIAYRSDLQPDSETEGAFYSSKELDFTYDSQGRPTGYSYLGTTTVSEATAYAAASGRVSSYTGTMGATTDAFAVQYQTGSDCLKTLTSANSSYVRGMTLESKYNVYKTVENKWGGASLGTFSATYAEARGLQDTLASGSTTTNSWSQLLGLGAGISQTFGYDEKRQLTSAPTPSYTGAAGTEALATTRNFGWTYDNQGNRLSQSGVAALTYAPDGTTNQYTSITGETNLAYDNDGNMSQDAIWTYTYDHENRLIKMVKTGQTVTFAYDYLGRRVQKTVKNGTTTVSDEKYIWAGRTLVADLLSDGATPTRGYIWGQDLSDMRGNAGGAGALIAQMDSGGVKYAMADQRGNVVGYINSSGAIVAAREFGAFGQVIDSYGTSDDYSMWFASKYRDKETDLVYYGLRYYQPKHGRFINRDPIEEAGGNNLYAFCMNRGVNGWDVLGLSGDDEGVVTLPPFVVTVPPDPPPPPIEIPTPPPVVPNDPGGQGPNPPGGNNNNNGGGDQGSDAQKSKAKNKAKNKPKTDCETLVENLLDLASTNRGFQFTKRNTVGWTMMGAARNFASNPAYSRAIVPTGFQPSLTAGGQNSEVYRHIYGYAGAALAYETGGPLIALGQMKQDHAQLAYWDSQLAQIQSLQGQTNSASDLRSLNEAAATADLHRTEVMSEINGDLAGLDTGDVMGSLINGDISKDAAREKLLTRLCK